MAAEAQALVEFPEALGGEVQEILQPLFGILEGLDAVGVGIGQQIHGKTFNTPRRRDSGKGPGRWCRRVARSHT
ncbi:MAG: hypothetical protein M3158_03630 [Pseudomonadota bacterium]|nr:hypothetical protein [Pseudomonadota bacterium]